MYEVKIKVLPERRSFREYKLQLGIWNILVMSAFDVDKSPTPGVRH